MSKAKAKTYKSEAMAAVHEMMEGLHDAGSIDKRTLREFDEACLAPAPVLSPDEIKAIREAEHVSQPKRVATGPIPLRLTTSSLDRPASAKNVCQA